MQRSMAAPPGGRARRIVETVLALAITSGAVVLLDFAVSVAWPSPLAGDLVQLRPRLAPSLRLLLARDQVLDELRFDLAPNRRTRMVRVVFGLDHELVDDELAVLSLSAIPELPSELVWIESGRTARVERLPEVRAGFTASRFRLRLHDGVLAIEQDGRDAGTIAFAPPAGPVHLALYPSYPMAYLRADFDRLKDLAVRWHDAAGSHQREAWRPWLASPLRPVALASFALLGFVRLRRWRCLRRAAAATSASALALVVGTILFAPRWCPSSDEQGPYQVDGRFDATRFAAAHGLDAPAAAPRLTLVAFGGSTTAGDPFEAGEGFDYPARLERRLAQSPTFAARTVRVANAAKVGLSLTSIDAILAPVIEAARPQAVMLSSVYNNLFDFDIRVASDQRLAMDTSITTLFAHIFGRPWVELRIAPASLDLYEAGLRCFAGIAAAHQVEALWIEEPIDRYYFGGANPTAPFQQILVRVAEELRVPIVRLQEEADRDSDRLRFYEYIHLTTLGYDWVAASLAAWFEAHPELVAPRAAPWPASVERDQVPACVALDRLRR